MTAKRAAEEAYTVARAAEIKGVSKDFVFAAIHRTEPPCLVAKNISTGKRPTYRIGAGALEAWWDSLPDG